MTHFSLLKITIPRITYLNPFHPAAIPKGARLADAFAAPPPRRRPVPLVQIAEIGSAPSARKELAGLSVKVAARRGQGNGDAPPPDLAEPLTRLDETKTKAAVPAPPVEQQLARISAETRSVERVRVYTPKPDGTMPLKRLRASSTDMYSVGSMCRVLPSARRR